MGRPRLVLLVEDDVTLARLLRAELAHAGFRVRSARSARAGLAALRDAPLPEMVLLDLGLPDRERLDALRDFRAVTPAPIIVITARLLGQDKIDALESGADDYLTKPFWGRELVARLRAVARRSGPTSPPALRLGAAEIDLDGRQICMDGREIHLTRTEWSLLEALLRRPGRVVARDVLIERALPPDTAPEALQVHMSRLRKKLGPSGAAIRTVWGIGYRADVADAT